MDNVRQHIRREEDIKAQADLKLSVDKLTNITELQNVKIDLLTDIVKKLEMKTDKVENKQEKIKDEINEKLEETNKSVIALDKKVTKYESFGNGAVKIVLVLGAFVTGLAGAVSAIWAIFK